MENFCSSQSLNPKPESLADLEKLSERANFGVTKFYIGLAYIVIL